MMIFDDGDGVRRQCKERLRKLEHERMVGQLRRLQQRPAVIARWWALLGAALTMWLGRAPRHRTAAGELD